MTSVSGASTEGSGGKPGSCQMMNRFGIGFTSRGGGNSQIITLATAGFADSQTSTGLIRRWACTTDGVR